MTFSIVGVGNNNPVTVATGGVFISKLVGTGSNQLLLSPASILAAYIIEELTTMTTPSDESTWPLYITHLPDGRGVEDDCGLMSDTPGLKDGRYMDGEVPQHPGVQLMIRSLTFDEGYAKIEDVASDLDVVIGFEISLASGDYRIENVSRTSPIIPLGIEEGTKRRFLFTINFLVTVKEI